MKSGRYLNSVRAALPENAQADLDRAFLGDALAARRLMILAPRRLRGHIAFLAYQAKVGNPAYREIVKAVWAKPTRPVLTGFWRPEVVRRMLARADFRIPEFSGAVTVFRAVSGARAKQGAAELCWSLSREKAIAEVSAPNPEILQSTIDSADIIYFGNSHGEQEVVSRHPVQVADSVVPLSLVRGVAAFGQAVAGLRGDFTSTMSGERRPR